MLSQNCQAGAVYDIKVICISLPLVPDQLVNHPLLLLLLGFAVLLGGGGDAFDLPVGHAKAMMSATCDAPSLHK